MNARTQAIRLSQVTVRDLHIWAEAYLEVHRAALVAEAIETVRISSGFRTLAEREARRRQRERKRLCLLRTGQHGAVVLWPAPGC